MASSNIEELSFSEFEIGLITISRHIQPLFKRSHE